MPRHSTPAIYAAMAGSPLKRARKQSIRLDDGSVIAFPAYAAHRRSPGLAAFGRPRTKSSICSACRMPLDRVSEIVYWPVLERDPVGTSLWKQVWHIAWKIGMKAMLDGARPRGLSASATGSARPRGARTAAARAGRLRARRISLFWKISAPWLGRSAKIGALILRLRRAATLVGGEVRFDALDQRWYSRDRQNTNRGGYANDPEPAQAGHHSRACGSSGRGRCRGCGAATPRLHVQPEQGDRACLSRLPARKPAS